LRVLREISYPALKPERVGDTSPPPGFSRLGGETLFFQVEIVGAEQIADLLAMTPHLYRASAEGRAKAAALTRLVVTVEVCLTRFGVEPLR
jgi:23S rRNA (guanine745-N1)-methyltransferase